MAYHDDPERQPLLPQDDYREDDVHNQFCQLIGVPPSDLPNGRRWISADRSLYARAIKQRRRQSLIYQMTASVTNLLLLAQLVLGAAVTGLGASDSPHKYITLLGASNTIIAGLVAYLKSRGQPNRARMYRDDLERVVDEIENSEIMWMGISKRVDGYDDIDTDDQVTVRSEVARLTRLYDKAVRNNTLNNPDMYGTGDGTGFMQAALKTKTLPSSTQAPISAQPGPTTAAPAEGAASGGGGGGAGAAHDSGSAHVSVDPDESPATAKPTPSKEVKAATGDDDHEEGEAAGKGKGKAEHADADAKSDHSGTKHQDAHDGASSDPKASAGTSKAANGLHKDDGDKDASKASDPAKADGDAKTPDKEEDDKTGDGAEGDKAA